MSYQTQVQTLQCPKCREYISVSAKQCRFCGSEVDSATANADARLQKTVAQAVDLARMARVAAWFLLGFWFNVLFFYFIGTETGFFILLPVLLLTSAVGSIVRWWTRYGNLQTADEDYIRARASMKTTAILAVIMLFIPPLMFFIAWSTGILTTLNII